MMFARMGSVEEAIAARQAGVTLLAGGTTIVDLMQLGVSIPGRLGWLEGMGLDHIEHRADGSCRIGALCRQSAVAADRGIASRFAAVAEAILSGSSGQIRNMATVGGNLLQANRCVFFRDPFSPCNKRRPGSGCPALEAPARNFAILGRGKDCIDVHPSDQAVALAALEAVIVVQGTAGVRRVPVEEFLPRAHGESSMASGLKADEVLTAIELPHFAGGATSSYVKIRDRHSYAFALVSAAAALDVEGDVIRSSRLALGGVAAGPWRSRQGEEALKDQRPTLPAFEEAARIALGDADGAGEAGAKRRLAQGALTEALVRAARMAGVKV